MAGYTQTELDDVQARWELRFPPDLCALYRERRYTIENEDSRFRSLDWISDEADKIQDALNWPFEGFLFDIRNGLWWPEWGDRPAEEGAIEEKFKTIFAEAPKLIPVYGHRYLPELPNEAGNPVFSVYQMDVIHYGANLEDYVARETGGMAYQATWPPLKSIPFWTSATEFNEQRFESDGHFTFLNRNSGLP